MFTADDITLASIDTDRRALTVYNSSTFRVGSFTAEYSTEKAPLKFYVKFAIALGDASNKTGVF